MNTQFKPARSAETLQIAQKRIRLRQQNQTLSDKIRREFGLSAVASRVLAARGYAEDRKIKDFIQPTLKEGLPSPSDLLNLDKACKLVDKTIKTGKPIAICCDFDVDGLSGGAQVHHFFKTIGVQSHVFVPDRFADGYGLNCQMIEKIAAGGYGLVIAIDYGTTNAKELELARKLGLKTIVIDHHHVGDLKCPADILINPNQKSCGFADKILCASGLAWYLVMGLRGCLKQAAKIDPKSYLDLACLGTICDMVPLTGPNRVIAKRGLELLSDTTRSGLIALKNVIGIKSLVSCTDVGFGIGPRLNAAGRMVHGEMVIELLTTDDTNLANKIARKLHKLNADRQEQEHLVKEQAIKKLEKLGRMPAALVVADKSFHTGVIGIVAQRLVENYYRPAAVMGADSEGIFKGSVRGIRGFSVVEALGAVSQHLIKFGGHEGAGGFSVAEDKVEAFSEAFVAECERRIEKLELEPSADADTDVRLDEIDMSLIQELRRFAPFGMGNPGPLLLVNDLKVMDVKELKGAHLKATLSDGTRFVSGLMWRQRSHPALEIGNRVNVAVKADVNNFNGVTEVQLNLQAVERV